MQIFIILSAVAYKILSHTGVNHKGILRKKGMTCKIELYMV